jgi:quercetin dioxygenase-like cupin family protein
MSIDAIVIGANDGRSVSMRGTRVSYKAEGKRPGDGPTVLEFTAAPGFSTGDHVHSAIEELFYVLEGEFQIRAGEQMVQARAGHFVLIPPGVPHGFGNSGDTQARLLLTISPAAVHERYFEELAALLAGSGPPDAQAIGELRKRYDTEQVSSLTA